MAQDSQSPLETIVDGVADIRRTAVDMTLDTVGDALSGKSVMSQMMDKAFDSVSDGVDTTIDGLKDLNHKVPTPMEAMGDLVSGVGTAVANTAKQGASLMATAKPVGLGGLGSLAKDDPIRDAGLKTGETFDKSDLIKMVVDVNRESDSFQDKDLMGQARDVMQDVSQLSDKLGLEEGDTIQASDMREMYEWAHDERSMNNIMDKFAEARTDSGKSTGVPMARTTTFDAPSLIEQRTHPSDGLNPDVLC